MDKKNDINIAEYTCFHRGGYTSFYPADTATQVSWMSCGDGTYTASDTLFYLNPGTYEIRLEVKNGETCTKSFTLF